MDCVQFLLTGGPTRNVRETVSSAIKPHHPDAGDYAGFQATAIRQSYVDQRDFVAFRCAH